MFLTHFYLMQGKKIETSLEAGNTLALNPQLFCQQMNKESTLC